MKKKKSKGGLSSVKDSTWLDGVLKQGLSEAPNVKWPKVLHFEDGGGAGGDDGGDSGGGDDSGADSGADAGADAGASAGAADASSDGGEFDNEPGIPSPFESYALARAYFSERQPWDATSLAGLSNRQPFNFNALWGGTQYAQGRVTDFSHIDSTQLQANIIAANTRNELWNEYDRLKAQGKTPAKNPDEVALDFYVKNVGESGSPFGYGPGVNTALITEAIKHQFLNSPDVIQSTGTIYQTPQEKLSYIEEFGKAHEAGVPTWQTFERQGYSKDRFGSLIPMIIGGMALGPLAGAFGGGFAGNALAGALIGGVTSEISGGDFGKGFLTGGIGGGLTGGISGVSEALQAANIPKYIADAAISAGSKAIMAGATGGDVEQAILGSLVGSGVGGTIGETGIDPSLAKIITPVVTTALLGGDVQSALVKSGLSALKDSSWGVNERTPIGGDAEAQEGGFYGVPSYYESLGYTPDMIKQLYEGTYAGSEQSEAEARDQLGDLYDLAYPEGFPTSSSAYEGLGYDANLINQLMQGTYSGPEQTEAEVRQQMGDELFNLAYPQGYNAAMYGTTGTTSGGTGTTSGGTAAGTTGTTAAGGTNYGALGQKIQNIFNTQEPNYPSPIKPYLSPNMLVGQIDRYAQQAPDYAQIIPKLAGILGQRGYKTGGSVFDDSEYVAGPEGKLYEKHYERGFAVGGPGTGQSDDIPTMLSDGEYVFDADTVAALGDGSSKAGAEILDKFRQEIRSHKRSAPTDRIPPKAKNPLAYLKSATKSKG